MKVRDISTGSILESNDDLVVASWKKRPDRFKAVKAVKGGKPARKSADQNENEAEAADEAQGD